MTEPSIIQSTTQQLEPASINDVLGELTDLAAVTPDLPVEVVPEAESIVEVTEPQPDVTPLEPEVDHLDLIMQRIVGVTDADKYMRLVIYGPPGSRKTSFCATAPNVLFFEFDTGGTKSLMNDPLLAVGVEKLPFRSMDQFNLLLDYLVNDDERLAKYNTFVIDTYNGLQAKDLDSIPAMSDGKPNYNINTQNMKAITDKLKHINKHVIVTAHIREIKNESTGQIFQRPDLTEKVASAVYADFDIIGYMQVQGDSWTLLVDSAKASRPTITAKTRIGNLEHTIENPNFPMILTAYEKMRADAKTQSTKETN